MINNNLSALRRTKKMPHIRARGIQQTVLEK
ncbi:MAG: hypothetical protein ACI8R0_003100, partial [Alteromonadales bacterium]